MGTYRCIDCEQHFCASCDDGEDCTRCGTTRCIDCAREHLDDHKETEQERTGGAEPVRPKPYRLDSYVCPVSE